jgi:hypothetical protein
VSSALDTLADELGEALSEILDAEEERLTIERDFLLGVIDGTLDGVNLEDPSTELTVSLLSGYISDYLPVEESEDG